MSNSDRPVAELQAAAGGSQKILLAVDGSDCSKRALQWCLTNLLNQRQQLQVICLFVFNVSSLLKEHQLEEEVVVAKVSEAVEAGKSLAEIMRRSCADAGLDEEKLRFIEISSSSPGKAIIDIADSEAVDLIVIGNRGLGKIRRTFLGSVSEFVLYHAFRPVAIIPQLDV